MISISITLYAGKLLAREIISIILHTNKYFSIICLSDGIKKNHA